MYGTPMSIYLFLHSNDNLKFLRFQEIESQASVNAFVAFSIRRQAFFYFCNYMSCRICACLFQLGTVFCLSLPADRGVTVLHHVSDVIQSNLKWRINPNSAAKIQTFFDICKYKNKIYQNSQKLILRPLFLFCNFS